MNHDAFSKEVDALRTQLNDLVTKEKEEKGRYLQHVTMMQKEMLAYTTKLLAEHAKSPNDTEEKFADLKNSFGKFQNTLEALKTYNNVKNDPLVETGVKDTARDAVAKASGELDKSIKYSMPEKLAIGMRTFAGVAYGVAWGAILAATLIVPLAFGIMAAQQEKTFSAAAMAFANKALLTPVVAVAQNIHFANDYGKRKQKAVDFDILPTNTESNPTNVFKTAMQVNRSEAIKDKLSESKKEEQQEIQQATRLGM